MPRVDGEMPPESLRNLRRLYDDARAEVNAGLDRLLVELEASRSQPDMEPYARLAEKSSLRVQQFLTESDRLSLGQERSGIVEAGVKAGGDLVKSLGGAA